jgi:hypothetical protein
MKFVIHMCNDRSLFLKVHDTIYQHYNLSPIFRIFNGMKTETTLNFTQMSSTSILSQSDDVTT